MNLQSEMNTLVQDFAAALHKLWTQAAIAALGGDDPLRIERQLGPFAKPRPDGARAAAGGGARNRRAKGEKRSPDEITELGERFLAYIRKNPGKRIEQINKAIGSTTKELALPIRKGIADGVIVAHGEKRSTTYAAKR